tara:strand:- start:66 stop:620 length:555 start_codon:yes stop_codon:yes gene_type:complete
MHNNLLNFFYFIEEFDKDHIKKLDKRVSIIYRNYFNKYNKKLILKIRDFCKNNKRKFYLANNINLALNLNLDGVYLPAFNKHLKTKKLNVRKKFLIIGSAHSVPEIKIKEQQGVQLIFLSPIFKTPKNNKFLNPIKFNFLKLKTEKKAIALGGINKKNMNQLKLTNINGFAAISYFRKNFKITH